MVSNEIIIITQGLPTMNFPDQEYRFEVDTTNGRISIPIEITDFASFEIRHPEQEAWLLSIINPAVTGGLYGHYWLEDGAAAVPVFLNLLINNQINK